MDLGIVTRAPMQPLAQAWRERPALSLERDETWTYEHLHEQSNRFANGLLELGAMPGDRIGMLLLNSLEYCALYFGIVKIGCIAVRLNFRLTPAELSYALLDSGCAITCVADSLQDNFTEVARQTSVGVSVALDSPVFSDPSDPDVPRPTEGDVAMLMYTSGTTGRPKAAIWTHSNTLWFGAMQAMRWRYGPEVTSLTTGPLYHCGAFEDLVLPTLMTGGHALITRSRGFEIERVAKLMGDAAVTDALLYPIMLADLVRSPELADAKFPELRRLITGGSSIAPAVLAEIARRWPHVRVLTAYGLTEGGSIATVVEDDDAVAGAETVGSPMPLNEIRIVREDGLDAGEGEEGEVLVRGPAVAGGYWGLPEESLETFPDGWCRTGDQGRMEDGRLVISGRTREMINSGGENVYPAEVEAALAEHPAVADAVVVGIDHSRLQEAVCAAVVLGDPAATTPDEIRSHCRERLAGYKTPRSIVFVDNIPRNAAGKADRALVTQMVTERLRAEGGASELEEERV